ncbi:MAG: hypothetical protein KGH58_02855 [Candidatus Micrarchaeota archaeon]|nr:hypothetical protein [Candidatus Micrarchaeota archaeon]
MDEKTYMGYMNAFAGANRLFCGCCGTETLSVGQMTLCAYCENIVDSTMQQFAERAPTIANSLANIKGLADGGDFAGALAAYKALDQKMESPQMAYAQALLYIRYSNSVLGGINYAKQGFMYENIDLRDKSLALISASKRLLARAIVLLTDSLGKTDDFRQRYLLFLCQMKFGKLRGAEESLAAIERAGQGALAAYCHLLLDAKTGDIRDMELRLMQLEMAGNMFLNSLYYSAYLDLKQGRAKSARMKLAALSSITESQSVEALMEEIKAAAIID